MSPIHSKSQIRIGAYYSHSYVRLLGCYTFVQQNNVTSSIFDIFTLLAYE